MRDNLIDNAKGILIFLVVLGHYLEAFQGWGNQYLRVILTFIYFLHMPAFIFLAGITAKKDHLGARIVKIAVILFIFQLAYVVPLAIARGNYPVSIIQPYWHLWFLLSLIWWMLCIPLAIRLPGAFLISIGISLAGGLLPVNGYLLSASRTMTFLPFFVAGYLYGNRIIGALIAFPARRLWAMLWLAATAAIAYNISLDAGWLYGSRSYRQLGVSDFFGVGSRITIFIVSSGSVIAFLALLTNKTGFLSTLGQNSLAVFILHGFAVIVTKEVIQFTGKPSLPLTVAIVLCASVLTTIFLAHPRLTSGIKSLSDDISFVRKKY